MTAAKVMSCDGALPLLSCTSRPAPVASRVAGSRKEMASFGIENVMKAAPVPEKKKKEDRRRKTEEGGKEEEKERTRRRTNQRQWIYVSSQTLHTYGFC